MVKIKFKFILTSTEVFFFFLFFTIIDTSIIFIQKLMVETNGLFGWRGEGGGIEESWLKIS